MKIIRNLIIVIVILAAIGYFVPIGYWSFGLGKYHEMTGNTSDAYQAYKTAAAETPENVSFVRAYARSVNDLAVERDDEDLYMEAYRVTEEWLGDNQHHNSRHLILIELARAEWGRDRKHNAKVAIDEAVEFAPTNYDALVYQGIIYRDSWNTKQKIQLSIPIFENALQARNFRNTYWAELELARAWWMIGDETRALLEIEQALSQFPPRAIRDDAERLKHEIQSSGRSER